MTATADATSPASAGRADGYSSPLPTPRPHLGHALASEWTKLTSVRSTVWTLGSLVALVVGIGVLAVLQTDSGDYKSIPFVAPALFGMMVGHLAVIVLGVLTITSEYGTGLIRTTFTASRTGCGCSPRSTSSSARSPSASPWARWGSWASPPPSCTAAPTPATTVAASGWAPWAAAST